MKRKLTVLEAVALAARCDRLFTRAARAWERNNSSKRDDKATERDKRTEARCQAQAEALLKPLGIACDYPGLYPSFMVRGHSEYSTLAAISAALEGGRK